MIQRVSRAGDFSVLCSFVAVLAESSHQEGVQQDSVFEELAQQLVSTFGAYCATVGLESSGRLRTVAAHPSAAQATCDLLHAFDASPAITAWSESEVVAVSDVSRHAERWPGYSLPAVQRGMHSVLSVPLGDGHGLLGAVSIVSAARDWSDDEIALVRAMTDVVALVFAVAQTGREHAVRVEQLQHALDRRVVVEQAKGVLAEAESISVDQAYARLRAFARSQNAKVEDVAQAVVRLGLRPAVADRAES